MIENGLDLLGWTGSMLLAFCALPQAVESWRTKSSQGITWGLLSMWCLGEFFTMAYVLPKMDIPLLFNYSANILFLSVIIYYKIFGRN
jgi:MtN3 and saliva related transmembrane protein